MWDVPSLVRSTTTPCQRNINKPRQVEGVYLYHDILRCVFTCFCNALQAFVVRLLVRVWNHPNAMQRKSVFKPPSSHENNFNFKINKHRCMFRNINAPYADVRISRDMSPGISTRYLVHKRYIIRLRSILH